MWGIPTDILLHVASNPDLNFLKNEEIEKVRSWQYDLVCNGLELGGGSIRITDANLQEKIFEILGHKKEEIKDKFGHLLEAFEYGAPPHGGVAFGLDRLAAIFNNENSIREVIAFPVTSSGESSVMEAPSGVDAQQLKELGIQIAPIKKDVKKK
jgi:aspartyl-tRNA synthetase